jgi:hypothetical protein
MCPATGCRVDVTCAWCFWLAGKESSPEEDEMLEYKAPFILPWIVLNKEMSPDQPESFVPFISGPEGVPSNCCHFTVCLECIAL